MKKISILKNPVQNYAWGSRTFIQQLMGDPVPADKPQAELWMGVHLKAPSQVFVDSEEMLQRVASDVEPAALALCHRLWPGSVTILFEAQ